MYQGYGAEQDLLRGNGFEGRESIVADVHVYVNRPPGKETGDLKDLEEALKALDHVYGVDVNSSGNVVAVSFEGGRTERETIEHAVADSGYEVSRISVRSTFAEE